jgi:hypothetical protein
MTWNSAGQEQQQQQWQQLALSSSSSSKTDGHQGSNRHINIQDPATQTSKLSQLPAGSTAASSRRVVLWVAAGPVRRVLLVRQQDTANTAPDPTIISH